MPSLVNEDSHFPRCRGIGMGDHVLQIQGVAPCGQMLKIRRKQDGQGTLVFERRKGQRRNVCLRCGQCAADPNKMPSKVGSLGNPLQEPDVCSGRRTETYRAEMRVGAVISSERCVMCLGQCFLGHKRLARLCFCRSHRAPCASCACSILISSDDEEGKQNVSVWASWWKVPLKTRNLQGEL